MPSSSAMDAVVHYKNKLMRHVDDPNPDVILHCLAKLDRVPMTIDILQETGVGRTVNSLKKRSSPDPDVASQSKAIVKKWKDIVANHEEMEDQREPPAPATPPPAPVTPPPEPPAESEPEASPEVDGKRRKKDRHHHKKHHKKDTHSSSSNRKRKKDKKESKRSSSSSSKHESSSPSVAKKLSAFDSALLGSGASSSNEQKTPSTSSTKSKPSSLVDIPVDLNPNYKPAPSYTLPDFPNSRHQQNGSLTKRTADEQLSALMSKKGTRNMMYSGVRRSAFKSVPTLQELCIHFLQEHVDEIGECGGLPYDVLGPILLRASPSVLMNIEEYNQYLMEDTGPMWETHCRRHYPKEQREEFESFREMYERCTREREEKLGRLTAKMGSSYKMAKETARKTKMAFVGQVAKPPRNVKKAQARNGVPNSVAQPSTAKRGRPPLNPGAAGGSGTAAKKPKIAPMMAKTLKLARGLKGGFRR